MPETEMPLRPQGLGQSVSAQPVAKGAVDYQIERGAPGAGDFWTVNTGFCATQADAANLAPCAAQEGFAPTVGVDAGESGAANGNRYNGPHVARNGRTAVGVAADGTVLLVGIDGRQPVPGVGASVPETAAGMAWLGAALAVTQDGGGSSNLVIGGKTVRPSV
ncbi:hypothetical protein BTRA_4900 [Burkholderia thailandensis USAMRU Malaysia |nr:hypothetical protein BTQ_5509 [Burkholderia thailandensis 2002721723]AHI81631.1 hypothetical protein BTJ_4165 [Burkholderia thailandensis E444]AIC90332.1 hypothetical protein BTRA_4900 [Burkholderia thailandensis USAMRU Malaysia \